MCYSVHLYTYRFVAHVSVVRLVWHFHWEWTEKSKQNIVQEKNQGCPHLAPLEMRQFSILCCQRMGWFVSCPMLTEQGTHTFRPDAGAAQAFTRMAHRRSLLYHPAQRATQLHSWVLWRHSGAASLWSGAVFASSVQQTRGQRGIMQHVCEVESRVCWAGRLGEAY